MVVNCDDVAVLGGVALWAVTVIRWRKDHGSLVCLCVLVVKVDHTPTAVWGGRHTVDEEQKGWYEGIE